MNALADDPYTHANLAAALLDAGEFQAGADAARAALTRWVEFAADLPPVTRADLGLPETALVLAAFHNGYKYNPILFAHWMRILEALPEAVLWLLTPSEPMRERLRAMRSGPGCPR